MQLIACFGGILICALEIVSHNYHSLSAQNPIRAEDFCSIKRNILFIKNRNLFTHICVYKIKTVPLPLISNAIAFIKTDSKYGEFVLKSHLYNNQSSRIKVN